MTLFNGTKVVNGAVDGYPVSGRISSPFGVMRDVFGTGTQRPHTGVDIVANTGAAVRSPAPGVVSDTFHLAIQSSEAWITEWKRVYGNSIIVQHGGYYCLYAHLSGISVREGQAVAAGDLLGLVGSTGMSTAPHLHWGMAPKPNRYLQTSHSVGLVNPLDFLSVNRNDEVKRLLQRAQQDINQALRIIGA